MRRIVESDEECAKKDNPKENAVPMDFEEKFDVKIFNMNRNFCFSIPDQNRLLFKKVQFWVRRFFHFFGKNHFYF